MAVTIAGCIDQLLRTGGIDERQAENILNQQRAAQGLPNPAQTALDNARALLSRQKYLAALQAQVISDLVARAQAHPEGVARGVQGILARDTTGKAKGSNVDQRREAINRQFTATMAEALNAIRFTRLGLHQDRQLLDNIVRELFGQSSGDSNAARFAKQIGDTMEEARVRFNEAGGDIPKRADWGLPQKHDAKRVMEAGLDRWKAAVLPRLDTQKMLGHNGLPMTPAELDAALDAAFETISTHGLNKLVPGSIPGKKLANQHQDHRFLVFKDADAWLSYDKEFGGGNPFFTIVGHLESMAGDIALMEVMGPNPSHAYKVLRDVARKAGAEGLPLNMIDAKWDVVGGGGSTGTLKLSTVENLHAIRNWLTSMKLGSAMLSAPSDMAFLRHAAAWNGLDQTRAVAKFVSLLDPTNAKDRLLAVRLGLTAEAWSSLALAGNRFAEVTGTGVSARAADLTMRLSGLSHWTDAGQKAIGLEWLMTTAEIRGKAWADVPAEYRGLLDEVGFTEADWNVLRTAPVERSNGVEMLDLPGLLQKNPGAQRAVNLAFEAVETLTGLAIPAPDANTRAISALAGGRGTLGREIAGSLLQFKSFPMAVILSHVYRGIHAGSLASTGAYLGSLTVGTTVMGALALQLKEISKGRTPRDMASGDFWGSAFLQGGGAGIFGDFVYSGMFGVNRFGGSLAETLAGPGVGAATDIARLTAGQFGEAITGEETNFATDLVNAAGSYTPVIGSLWYTRLAYERLVLNQLQLQVDPSAREKFRRDAKRRKTEFGSEYWWRRGELTPE